MKFIIEICEEPLSKWMLLELEHASLLIGKENLCFTNVKPKYKETLSRLGEVFERSIVEIKEFHDKIIVLDPKSPKTLETEEARKYILIVGGIMGDHPPKGRTYELITSKIEGCLSRNLGKYQLSIDGAIFVAKEIMKGKRLEEIPLIKRLVLKVDPFHEIILPYAYPIVEGRPLFYEKLEEYLKYGIEEDEENMLKASSL